MEGFGVRPSALTGDKCGDRRPHQDHVDLIDGLTPGPSVIRVLCVGIRFAVPVNDSADGCIREFRRLSCGHLIDMELQDVSCLCDDLPDLP